MTRLLITWLALSATLSVQSAELPVATSAASKAPLRSDPRVAIVAPTDYRSAFSGYRAISDEPAASWREANDLVARIGGWRVYARESQQPAAAAQTPAATEPHKH